MKLRKCHSRGRPPPGDEWFDGGHSWDLGADQPRSPKKGNPLGALMLSRSRSQQQQDLTQPEGLTRVLTAKDFQSFDSADDSGMYRMRYAVSKDIPGAEFDRYGGPRLSRSWGDEESSVEPQWREEEEPLRKSAGYETRDWFEDEAEYSEDEQDDKSWGLGSATSASGEMRQMPSLMDDDSGSEQSNHIPMKVVRSDKRRSSLRDRPPPAPRASANNKNRPWRDSGQPTRVTSNQQNPNSKASGKQQRRPKASLPRDAGQPTTKIMSKQQNLKSKLFGKKERKPKAPPPTPERERKPRAQRTAEKRNRLHSAPANAAEIGFVGAATAQVLTEVLSHNSQDEYDYEVPTQGMKGLVASEPGRNEGTPKQTEEAAPSDGKAASQDQHQVEPTFVASQDQHQVEPTFVEKQTTVESKRNKRHIGAAAAVAAVAGISTAIARRRSRSLQRTRSVGAASATSQAGSKQDLVPDSAPEKTETEQNNQEAEKSANDQPSAKDAGHETVELSRRRTRSFGFLRKLRKCHTKEAGVHAEETSDAATERKMTELLVEDVAAPSLKPDAVAPNAGETTAAGVADEQNVGPTATEPMASDFCGVITSCFGFNSSEVNGKNQDAKTMNFSTMPNDGLQLDDEMDIDKAASIARRRRRREPIPIKAISFHTEPMEHDALTINSSVSISEVFNTLPNVGGGGEDMTGPNLKKKRSFLGRMRSKTGKKTG